MRIQRIETFTRDPLCIVKVTTDDGATGFGQTAPFHADITAMVLHKQIARHALGADATDIAGLAQRCIQAEYKFPWSYVCRATCGIETALWDLHGKVAGKPVCELLGGKPRAIPVYGSSMRRDIKPQDEAQRLARLRDQKGFRAFKVRVGKVCGHDEDQWPGRTEALIPAVRRAVGDDVRLLADGNSGYTPARAIEVGRLLEDHAFSHFEEPCPYWELEWTQQVAAALRMPVAGGEQDNDLAQWRRMIRMRAVDIVQPDVCYVGGLARAARVAEMAAAAGLPCVPHSANLSLVSVFTVHLLAAIPNAGPHMEFSIEPSPWAEGLYRPTLDARDGHVAPLDGPGWGVTLSDAWLAGADHVAAEAS
ncbi:MAG TPA: mandelate racemase/muconate lactonizing enzyme family protein [Planctomycetota bacterium]|nr:mandelate racemase/muconate lactonizing enzyme family protein [Planctomycetota bacterium]HRR80444.1 mandelate racemase/muconate lactonizing enzyme family protein [Planctomycetota bacterium]HRT96624.1 mandelate racemase/muconate lactonizing enzyme family protein [Planctomycetota bacterium]